MESSEVDLTSSVCSADPSRITRPSGVSCATESSFGLCADMIEHNDKKLVTSSSTLLQDRQRVGVVMALVRSTYCYYCTNEVDGLCSIAGQDTASPGV